MLGWKLLPPLILIFQDASDEMGTEGPSALGSHPRVTGYNKVTPWSSSSSPLHPFHYRQRENSKVFSNSMSPLLESSPKPWIRLTRHVLIESIYFSFLNSHHTSSHPLWFNCVDAHSAIWKAPLPHHFTWLSPPCTWTWYLPGGFLWLTEAESHASAMSWLNVLSPIATIAYSLCCYCLFSYHLSSEIISSLCY